MNTSHYDAIVIGSGMTGGWAAKHMPGDAPGTLALDDYVAILAFDLHANGVDLGAEPFTLDRAAQITIHP